MIRPAILSASLLALPLAARAQSPASPAPAGQTQLDRIESKLDLVLRRLDEPRPSGAGQAQTAAPSPASETSPAASIAAYKPGALAIARVAPKNADSLSEVPADSVGGFVYEGGPIPFTNLQSQGVRYAGPAAVELQGWLRAKEAGRYQFGTDLAAHSALGAIAPTCVLQAWLEGHSLDQRSVRLSQPGKQDANASLVLGAELQPGIYRLRVWTACTAPEGVATTSELLIKTPSELNLRPITGNDLVHKET